MENERRRRTVIGTNSEVENSRLMRPRSDVGGELDIVRYWFVVKPWWKRIVGITLVAMLLTQAMDHFVRTQWYRASTTIRPASQEGPTSPLVTMMGSPLLGGGLSSLMAGTGLGATPSDVAEQMAIMSSFDFVASLVQRHDLTRILRRTSLVQWLLSPVRKAIEWTTSFGGSGERQGNERWQWYEAMKGRFSSTFDDKDGNLVITFEDPEPAVASRVLGFYIDDLREKLRNRAILDAKAAAESLEVEMGRTPDPLIHAQIAALIAQQIQQEKTAEVQASFAFTVIEPPFVSDDIYRPNAKVDCVIVGMLTPGLILLVLLGRAAISNLASKRQELGEDTDEEPSAAALNGIEPGARDSSAASSLSR